VGEALLEHVYSGCAPPVEVEADGYLFLYFTPWHGGPDVFDAVRLLTRAAQSPLLRSSRNRAPW
jgi:hypothetical protein